MHTDIPMIRRGTILHSYSFVQTIGHGKFFVVIGVSQAQVTGFFFINSQINRVLQDKPAQLALQYPIFPKDYPFLSHPSFICATEISKIPLSDIQTLIHNGQASIKGSLLPEHLAELLKAVRQSRLFTVREKKDFF